MRAAALAGAEGMGRRDAAPGLEPRPRRGAGACCRWPLAVPRSGAAHRDRKGEVAGAMAQPR